jgi:hypothetical protein
MNPATKPLGWKTPTVGQLQAQRDRLRGLAMKAGALKGAAASLILAGQTSGADVLFLVAARLDRELAEARRE